MSFTHLSLYPAPPVYQERTWLAIIMTLWVYMLSPLIYISTSQILDSSWPSCLIVVPIYFIFDLCWTIFSIKAKAYFTTGNMFLKNSFWVVLAVVLITIGSQSKVPYFGCGLGCFCLANYLLLSTTSWWKPYKLLTPGSKAYEEAVLSQPRYVIVRAANMR